MYYVDEYKATEKDMRAAVQSLRQKRTEASGSIFRTVAQFRFQR